ncbi:MAG: hypothetical protein ACR2RV_17965, partial [Verrucomicrobiales bacterium]
MRLPLLLILAALAPSAALAQSSSSSADMMPNPLQALVQTQDLTLRADYSYTFDSDFKDSSLGSLSVSKLNLSARTPISLTDKLRVITGVNYRRLDFDSDSDIIPDHMQGLSALVNFEYLIGGQPAIGLLMSPGFYFIDDINSDSFDIPTIFYASWRFTPSFIGIGGAGYSGLRADNPVIPLAGFIWTISEDVKLNAIFPVASLDFDLNDRTKLSIIGEYSGIKAYTGDGVADENYRDTALSYSEMRAGVQLGLELAD